MIKDLSEIFQHHFNHYFGHSLVTLTETDVSPDLSLCRVYISVLPIQNAPDIMDILNQRKSEIRKYLGNKIGKRIRKIPELAFFHDTTEEKASEMDRLIDNLNIPPDTDDQ